jgi:Sec-independent protein translocase protein TatA
MKGETILAAFCLAVLASGPAAAQGMFIYPAQGQSQEQQSRDQYECHTWAVQQTGFDPMNPQSMQAPPPSAAPPPKEATEGGVLRGGARGAAVGAVAGAIAGDAGKGAAIGAASGGLIGGMRRNDQQRRQQQSQQNYQQQQAQAQAQHQAAMASQRDAYDRAVSACLVGRGYTVN